jgi:hypothetical protein
MASTTFGAVQVTDSHSGTPTTLEASHISEWQVFLAGNQSTGTKKAQYLVPYAGTIVDVRAYADTAPATQSIVLDLMQNGTTMFSTTGNRPTIAASGHASTTTLPDVVAVAAGDRLRLDVIQVGTGTVGADLTFTVSIKRAHVA